MNYQIKPIDYSVFILSIIIYAIIGIYFGCFGTKQKSATEYLYGKKSLKAIPIGLSIYSSSLSAVSILGVPQEIYIFGPQFILHTVGAYLSLIITWYFVVPVFKGGNKKFKAPYEYYEYRFSKAVRFVSTFIYIINCMSAVPIILYTCCLPISEGTGVNVIICSTILGAVCVVYTMLGGFTTVIWTDVIQAILMIITIICLVIASVIRVGGFQLMWVNAEKGGRTTFFDFDFDPFKRITFWGLLIGTMFNHAAFQGCSASTLQRYISVKTEKDAKVSAFIGVIGFSYNMISATVVGLCMYSFYHGCDPVVNKELNNYNQLAPYFALETLSALPGLSGLLIAGLLSAGLSSMSAELNTISGLIYYDFIKNNFQKYNSDATGAFVMKLIVLIFGVYFIGIVFVVQKIKYIIPIVITFSGAANGLKLGLLILGSAFPKANAKGALTGIVIAGIFMSWLAINATTNNIGSSEALPVSVENCTNISDTFIKGKEYFNYTTIVPTIVEQLNVTKPEPFLLYKLSFLYYALVGMILTICVALIVSYATGGNDFENMDPTLFVSFVRPKKVTTQNEKELQSMLNPGRNNNKIM